jgi:hypothetical protein
MIAWVPIKYHAELNTTYCEMSGRPPSWGYLPFLFQSVFDLLVFVLCLAKVNLSDSRKVYGAKVTL